MRQELFKYLHCYDSTFHEFLECSKKTTGRLGLKRKTVYHKLGNFVEDGLGIDEYDIWKNFFIVEDQLQPMKVLQCCLK
jgi:hypothetical protein